FRPRLMLFDEPTRGIDVGAKAEIYAFMRTLADDGVAIVMISSDMEEMLGNSDRVAVMHEGRITGVLERAECTEESIMRLAVAGRDAKRKRGSAQPQDAKRKRGSVQPQERNWASLRCSLRCALRWLSRIRSFSVQRTFRTLLA